jgi:hypothetical protein
VVFGLGFWLTLSGGRAPSRVVILASGPQTGSHPSFQLAHQHQSVIFPTRKPATSCSGAKRLSRSQSRKIGSDLNRDLESCAAKDAHLGGGNQLLGACEDGKTVSMESWRVSPGVLPVKVFYQRGSAKIARAASSDHGLLVGFKIKSRVTRSFYSLDGDCESASAGAALWRVVEPLAGHAQTFFAFWSTKVAWWIGLLSYCLLACLLLSPFSPDRFAEALAV